MHNYYKQISKLVLGTVAPLMFLQSAFSEGVTLAKTIENASTADKGETKHKERGEVGWTIRQSDGTVTEFTAHSVRVDISKLGFVIIAKAPTWSASFFNKRLKSNITLPYKNWLKRFDSNPMNEYQNEQGKFALITKMTDKTTTIQKHNCLEYLVFKKAEQQKHVHEEKISQLWIASDIRLPMQTARIYCRFLDTPEHIGFPLKVSSYSDGKMTSTMETTSIEKHRIPDSTFDPLPGYQKAKNVAELVLGTPDKYETQLFNEPVTKGQSTKKVSTWAK